MKMATVEENVKKIAATADANTRVVETLVGRAKPENVLKMLEVYHEMAKDPCDETVRMTGVLCVESLTRALTAVIGKMKICPEGLK